MCYGCGVCGSIPLSKDLGEERASLLTGLPLTSYVHGVILLL